MPLRRVSQLIDYLMHAHISFRGELMPSGLASARKRGDATPLLRAGHRMPSRRAPADGRAPAQTTICTRCRHYAEQQEATSAAIIYGAHVMGCFSG